MDLPGFIVDGCGYILYRKQHTWKWTESYVEIHTHTRTPNIVIHFVRY